MTRILVVNPNISDDVTELIRAEAERAAGPGTEIAVRTASRGVEFIETRFEALLAAYAVAEILAEEHERVDAAVIAAFGDPGMPALREAVDIPVIGITEASLHTAAMLGARIGVVAISARMRAWYTETIESLGFGPRLAGFRSLDRPVGGVRGVQREARARLLELARMSVSEDGADVLLLAGAPLAGLARTVVDELPVPVVDGVSAGVRQATAIALAAPAPHRTGSFARPPVKPNRGLPPAIERLLHG